LKRGDGRNFEKDFELFAEFSNEKETGVKL